MKKKDKDLEEWQKNQISKITLDMILSATCGTLAAALIAVLLKNAGMGEIKPELLFIPWGIAVVVGVSMAFRKGVLSERRRVEEAGKSK